MLGIIRDHARPEQKIFVGVIDPIDPRVETPEEVRDRVLEAAEFIAPERLGTTDDCGFSPFGDDLSTARDTAFAKIRARVLGTEMASRELPTRSLDPGYPDPARFVDDEVVFREFCCPGCGVRLASETGYPGEAPFHELQLD